MESGRAVQFINIDENTGMFQIQEEAAAIFEESENQVAVISIAGKYRTGKSLLMNLLCGGTENLFEVSASVDACTRGIWFYSEPITIKKDEEIIDIYIMDSEGLGGIDKTQNYDIQIFTLSMLLSSFFIFNSVGVIDENSLSTLSLVTTLADKIQSMEDEEDAVHLINHFPSFLWVLRDFVLDLKDDDGNEISSDQYLELILEEVYADHHKAEEHNHIRETIKRFFPERYWATLIRPWDDERDLQRLRKDPNLLKPDYVKQINDLRNFILNQIGVKSVGDIGLTGTDYVSVVIKYVEAINEGAIPKIEDSWAAVVESQLSNGYTRSIKSYEEDMRKFEAESMPWNEDELERAHKGIMQSAVEIFLEITKGFDNQEKQEAYDTLQENIEGMYEEFRKTNNAENEERLGEEISNVYREEILSKEFKSVEEYMKTWNLFQTKFLNESDSYKKYEVWANFSQDKISDGCIKLVRKLDMKSGLKEKQLEMEVNKLQTMLELKENDTGDRNKLEKEIQSLQEEKGKYLQREQELKEEVIAWRELLDTKDEEIDIMTEKYQNLKRQRDEMQTVNATPKQNIRKDHILIEETGKSATCSSNDCVIF